MEKELRFTNRWFPVIAVALGLTLAATTVLSGEGTPAFPKEFRSWTHTKSMVIPDKNHGLYGFHDIYANKAALASLKKGGTFKEGSAMMVTFHDVVVDGGATSQGKKLWNAYMKKEKSAVKTGGWMFAAFEPDGKPKTIDPVKDCFECHRNGAKSTDFVFHKYID